jgi:hypothetical protein
MVQIAKLKSGWFEVEIMVDGYFKKEYYETKQEAIERKKEIEKQ